MTEEIFFNSYSVFIQIREKKTNSDLIWLARNSRNKFETVRKFLKWAICFYSIFTRKFVGKSTDLGAMEHWNINIQPKKFGRFYFSTTFSERSPDYIYGFEFVKACDENKSNSDKEKWRSEWSFVEKKVKNGQM